MLETYPQENMNTQAIRELTDEVFRLKQIINELNGGGDGNLPEPTIADAGKVLGVDDQGKYALVEGGGGGSVVTLNVLYDEVADDYYINTNYNTLKSYMESGTPVVIIESIDTEDEKATQHNALVGLIYFNDIINEDIGYRAFFGVSTQAIASTPTDNMYISK